MTSNFSQKGTLADNDFDTKKRARHNRVLLVTKVLVSVTQCALADPVVWGASGTHASSLGKFFFSFSCNFFGEKMATIISWHHRFLWRCRRPESATGVVHESEN